MASYRLPVRMIAVAAAAILPAAVVATPTAAAETGGSAVASNQKIVMLLGRQVVRSGPSSRRRKVATVSSSRPISGQRTGMPVIAERTDSRDRVWLRVRLPGRALGQRTPPRTGWIKASNTMLSTTPWHIVVDISSRSVEAYRSGRQVRSFKAIVGKPDTPTPTGHFFVEENLRLPSDAAGAPFALALSARSRVFQEFEGGPGQVALHGINNIGGELGTAVSHGCVRLSTDAITWLSKRIGQGYPVTINR